MVTHTQFLVVIEFTVQPGECCCFSLSVEYKLRRNVINDTNRNICVDRNIHAVEWNVVVFLHPVTIIMNAVTFVPVLVCFFSIRVFIIITIMIIVDFWLITEL